MEILDTSLVRHFNILRAWPEPSIELWKEPINPTLEELKGKMLKFLKLAGFRTRNVTLDEATCIVRSFEGDHLQSGNIVLSFYGVFCYVREGNQWISTTLGGHNFSIHLEKQVVPIMTKTGELIEAETDDFEDLYLAVS